MVDMTPETTPEWKRYKAYIDTCVKIATPATIQQECRFLEDAARSRGDTKYNASAEVRKRRDERKATSAIECERQKKAMHECARS
jgi:hypothetical protein